MRSMKSQSRYAICIASLLHISACTHQSQSDLHPDPKRISIEDEIIHLGNNGEIFLSLTISNVSDKRICVLADVVKSPDTNELDFNIRYKNREIPRREIGVLRNPGIEEYNILPGGSEKVRIRIDRRYRFSRSKVTRQSISQ